MVNVEYIHALIKKQWGITVPTNPALTNPKVAANMKYLLTAVDRANEMLNGRDITNYGNGEYATLAAADTVVTSDATLRLINIEPKFFVNTTDKTKEFSFSMSAIGLFAIDWGDGEREIVSRTNSTLEPYSHTYDVAGEYKISIGGLAWGYSSNWGGTVISFQGNENIASVGGSLGAVFPTIGDGDSQATQPCFFATFSGCSNLTGISPDLFKGVRGNRAVMFRSTFQGCNSLKTIPAGLFADISGAASSMFMGTFMDAGIASIPAGLFNGISGGAESLFYRTFEGCSNLETIPGNLFEGVSAVDRSQFNRTFFGCISLTEVPAGLFANISDVTRGLFYQTFMGCTNLRTIPGNLFANVSGAETTVFAQTFAECENLQEIPSELFAKISGVGVNMFYGTFQHCVGLTAIPEKLFENLGGDLAEGAFLYMFQRCSGLTGQSARIGGVPLYEIWPDATGDQVGGCYNGDANLSDWDKIPSQWK